jgi:putative membrane protein
MNATDPIRWAAVAGFALLWAGGVFSYAVLGGPPEGVAWTAPAFLALAAVVVLAYTPRRHWGWLGLAAAIGFVTELFGVAFGVPFGGYHYTGVLAPTFLGVPLVLGCAWLVLVVYVQHQPVLQRVPRLARPVLAAAWMTALDFVIDPLAAGPLGYWRWDGDGAWYGIPWTNFLGWFVTSLVIFALVPRGFRPPAAARVVGSAIMLFFPLIAAALAMWPLVLLGAALLLPDALAAFKLARESRAARQRVVAA